MTRAERARLIDKQEFEAECKAARERAFAYAEECRRRERQEFCDWVGKPEAELKLITKTRKLKPVEHHTYDGLSLTISQWAERLGVSASTLYTRKKTLGSITAAIAFGAKDIGGQKGKEAAANQRVGVVSNLSASRETGAGGSAQDTSNITFQENSKCQQ